MKPTLTPQLCVKREMRTDLAPIEYAGLDYELAEEGDVMEMAPR